MIMVYRKGQRELDFFDLIGSILLLLFVCLLSGPATDDKHCFDCLLVVSTINLFGPGRTNENKQNEKKTNGSGSI